MFLMGPLTISYLNLISILILRNTTEMLTDGLVSTSQMVSRLKLYLKDCFSLTQNQEEKKMKTKKKLLNVTNLTVNENEETQDIK